jgi:hypothetical protein
VKVFHHPVVGELTVSFEAMELSADAGLILTAYIAEPGSPSADALSLLATWGATLPRLGPHTCGREAPAHLWLTPPG